MDYLLSLLNSPIVHQVFVKFITEVGGLGGWAVVSEDFNIHPAANHRESIMTPKSNEVFMKMIGC